MVTAELSGKIECGMKRRSLVSLEALLLFLWPHTQFDVGVLTWLSGSLLGCDRQRKEERGDCLELYNASMESGKCAITQTERYYTSCYVGESRAFHGGTFCFLSAFAYQTEVILL